MKKLSTVALTLSLALVFLPACFGTGGGASTTSKFTVEQVLAIARATNQEMPPDREGITYSATFAAEKRTNTSWAVTKTIFGTIDASGSTYVYSIRDGSFYEDTEIMAWDVPCC